MRSWGTAIDTPDKILHPKKRAFLAAYAKCGIIGTSARHAGIHRYTYYEWCEHDQDFANAAKLAYSEACDYLEEVALQRATLGHTTVKEIYERGPDGEPVLVRRDVTEGVSDTMLAMMLNGAKPEKYKQRTDINVTSTIKAVDAEFWAAV